ncbi:hypothetical protein B0O80DRAFT_502995 [Mortierella sp. GBAus27b]|nr:hypothetical protein BGX31_002163 [Mortierella sp. GBA43]KAI8347024.1 hypothetical protein B0O80DRAFT_502995 [Mortierella sp. GBAus27b]
MASDEPLQTTVNASSSTPLSTRPASNSPRALSHSSSLPQLLIQSSPALTALDYLTQPQRPKDPSSLTSPTIDTHADNGNDKTSPISPRTGSTGSQIVSPTKKTGRRILQRPRPLDLDQSKLNVKSVQQHQPQQPTLASAPAPDQRPGPTSPALASGSVPGIESALESGNTPAQDLASNGGPKESKNKQRFPILQIKTDLNAPLSFRRSSTVPTTSSSHHHQSQQQQQHQPEPSLPAVSVTFAHDVQRKEPSKWHTGLERLMKKIQRRKKAPSNLAWYATHSTESYLSGATLHARPGALKDEVDPEAPGVYFGQEKLPKWVMDSLQGEDLFFSDETVELMLNLRDYLIKATESGWDITELKEDTFPVEPKSLFHHNNKKRSASPVGSPHRTTAIPQTAGPASPGGVSNTSAPSSRRGSRSSFEFEFLSQAMSGRHAEEEAGSYQLLDYLVAILSDVVSHDCRYRLQHPRPSRPEWILHSIVLDIMLHVSRELTHDPKAIYDLGMIALSAFPVFKNTALVRLMDLLTDTILPSFAYSRTHAYGSSGLSPPLAPLNPSSPVSPSEIRVQLDNNQTFAIQVHSPTEEQGMLAVPRDTGQSSKSPNIPNSRASSISLSRPLRGTTVQIQDSTMNANAKSLVTLTLLAMVQQISLSRSPLPVTMQLQKSIGDLLRIKPDLPLDMMELISIVDSEVLVHRALEVLWWIGWPALGHHILGEKLNPLDYESILLTRQVQHEWELSRKAAQEEKTIQRGDNALRNNLAAATGIRSKFANRANRKGSQGAESITLPPLRTQQDATATSGTDYLADHELYPYLFIIPGDDDQDTTLASQCERCEVVMKGFGLHCYRCRGALHLECFYSLKRFNGIDCMQPGCALDHVSMRIRNRLMFPDEKDMFEGSTNQTLRIRDSHHLRLVNLFSTCLCSACKLPFWGHHHQAYKCQDCDQLLHADCKGTAQDCSTSSQPLVLRHLFPTTIPYVDLRQSFLEFYRELMSTWESQPSLSPIHGAPSMSSPAGSSSAQPKQRYSYEEASCIASALTLQVELLKNGIARGEIQVQDPLLAGQYMDESLLAERQFELMTLRSHFAQLEQSLRVQSQSLSLALSDFFEETQPDMFLLFSTRFWSHFSAVTKTLIKEVESARSDCSRQHSSSPFDGPRRGEDMFTVGTDPAHQRLLLKHAVQTDYFSLASIFRFGMKRLGFQSSWTMQLVLQEWAKIGLLERLDGEIFLFEKGPQEPAVSPLGISPPIPVSPVAHAGSAPAAGNSSTLPTFQKSYFDISVGSTNSRSTPVFRNVYCVFPMMSAIDPTSDVENLIQVIWRCLGSVDLSMNECGFLLLTRQSWPDPFMSDYTKERLLGCVLHWLLMEDNQLFVIHRNYASKGRKLPGVRIDLEEQIARKRMALNSTSVQGTGANGTENNATGSPVMPPFMSPTGRTASSSWINTGNMMGSMTAGSTMTGLASGFNINANANTRTNTGSYSNQFGTVGSYMLTRKLLSKKFALPWLKQLMNLDPKAYVDMVYRQVRVLEREMATDGDGGHQTQEQEQKFRHAQVERYIESIGKLHQAGFLFDVFSATLCKWLEEVERMLDGMDITGSSFKALNRLFIKASSSSSNGGSRVGSGLGFGTTQNNTHVSGHSTPGSGNRSFSAGAGDSEWRTRLKAKLYQGSNSSTTGSNSLASMDASPVSGPETVVPTLQPQQNDDVGENPLATLRVMLKAARDQQRSEEQRMQKALFWLDLMVQSGVQVPAQAFLECCECLIDIAGKAPTKRSLGPAIQLTQSTEEPQSRTLEQEQRPSLSCSEILEQSKTYLKTCWEHIVLSTYRIAENEASGILDTVLSTNQTLIQKVMSDGSRDVEPEDRENVRQVLKYALVIAMYVYGCPIHATMSLDIAPVSAKTKAPQSQQGKATYGNIGIPLLNQPNTRKQRQSYHPIELDREAVPIKMFLKCLRSPSLALHKDILGSLVMILEHGQRISNMDSFVENIQKEVVPCLWDLLSPLNDHMVDTTLPLFMRLVTCRPAFLHKIVDRQFNSPDWETRFSALDSAFGLFSKLEDAMVVRLFFERFVTTASPQGTMLSNKGKGVDKNQRKRDRQQHQQTRTWTSSFDPDFSEFSGTGLSGQGRRGTLGSQPPSGIQQPQQRLYPVPATYTQFLPERLQILGPVFSHFVSSMWDKEDAVRTKAKTLLKSLQPVHVCHALKSWELHFVNSPPDVQQTLLKLMTRLNNYFPSWRIMDYGLVFNLLTSGELGRFVAKHANDVVTGLITTSSSAASSVHGDQDEGQLSRSGSKRAKELKSKRSSVVPLSLFGDMGGVMLGAMEAAEASKEQHEQRQLDQSTSFTASFMPGGTPMAVFMPTGESSRSQQRASTLPGSKPESPTDSTPPAATTEDKDREKQLALEDDINCSLLNLALQMVANGIEPRLDEVIQLKYLVVFYLDFEGCELVSLGQGKFQVHYGEYIPRQRVSPILGDNAGGNNSGDVLLNDPGHEAFVMTICRNLQLILDRYVEIKPDDERELPTLYERSGSRDGSQRGGGSGGGSYVYGGQEVDTIQSDSHIQGGRTFTSATNTSADQSKDTSQIEHPDEDGHLEQGPTRRSQRLFSFTRHKSFHDGGSGSYAEAGDSIHRSSQHQYQLHQPLHGRRNRRRKLDENTPVVGAYFVDVILRFFGSETDLSALPTARLKGWLELLLVVIYKYEKEVQQLSDLVVVLMKRIVETLMVKRHNPAAAVPASVGAGIGSGDGSGGGTMTSATNVPTAGATGGGGGGSAGNAATVVGEESMSEENTLLAISICSTLLKRSSTMTTALLSREIMAMSKLMTRRKDDPEDPVFVRAMTFLHDAFVHFMGSGLFVLVFKTQPVHNMNLIALGDDSRDTDQDFDLFYVLATVLGEDEMIPLDPTNDSGSATHAKLVHFRDQPIRDIVDRVAIFRDLEPVQVSTILINLALYVERVHSTLQDPTLFPDMAQLLIKITKYTAEWEHQQSQKQKEQAQQLRLAQERQNYLQNHFTIKPQTLHGISVPMILGKTSTMTSTTQKPQSISEDSQRRNTITSLAQSLSAAATSSASSPPPGAPESEALQQSVQQSTVPSTGTSESPQPTERPKSPPPNRRTSSEHETPPAFKRRSTKYDSVYSQTSTSTRQQTTKPPTSANQNHPVPSSVQHQQHWTYGNAVLGMCSSLIIQNPTQGRHLITAVKQVLKQALYRDMISANTLVRLVTAYCYMAELDYSLPLENAFGEFLVEELKACSIMQQGQVSHHGGGSGGGGRNDDHDGSGSEDDGESVLEDREKYHVTPSSRRYSKAVVEKEKDKDSKDKNHHHHHTTGKGATAGSGGGRHGSKILPCNFHLLYHLLLWDVDPAYNAEWTRIKWEVLGSMRFQPGQPILFPGADSSLHRDTRAIVNEWVHRYSK